MRPKSSTVIDFPAEMQGRFSSRIESNGKLAYPRMKDGLVEGAIPRLNPGYHAGVQIIQMINELSRNGMMKGTFRGATGAPAPALVRGLM